MVSLPPLAAEKITIFHSIPITNTYLTSLGVVILVVVFSVLVQLRLRNKDNAAIAPRGLVNFLEAVLEFILGYIDRVTGERKKSLRFLPIVGTLFLFILVSNWFGLLPGIGSIGLYRGGEFIPLFRSANSDLNLTLAMAVFAVIGSHLIGIMAIGFFRYANKFIKLADIYHAFKSLQPVKILVAIVEFFVGLVEVISEVAKMASLSLRLFGNVFAGEVLLTVLASLVAYIVPLPFMALELLVGLVQATVFSMLTLVYLTIATTEITEHEKVGKHEKPNDNETLVPTPSL